MNEREAWIIIDSNLTKLVSLMVTVQKGTQVEVFCDASGKSLSFSKPLGEANIKLCAVTAPDLEGSYGVRRKGNSFVNDDGEEIAPDKLASYLTQFITGMKDGGNEWGWEFKLGGG
ncbi:MAG: hypothetical protein ACLQJ0_28610 [Steroidobacteraceae bacterium]|jgi:hypothetical protein